MIMTMVRATTVIMAVVSDIIFIMTVVRGAIVIMTSVGLGSVPGTQEPDPWAQILQNRNRNRQKV